MININKYFVKPTFSIREVIKKFNSTGRKCLIVSEDNKFITGVISDGDIRKAILKGSSLKQNIINIFNRKPIIINIENYSEKKVKEIFVKKHIDLIPLVKKNNKIEKIIFWEDIINDKKNNLNLPVVIMAGGKGTRLEPLTQVLPKPLIPIENTTIIEKIISNFNNNGSRNFYVSINYKSKMIRSYFEELKPTYKVHFIEEKKPLGTIGAISKLKKIKQNDFFITNCDIIAKINYSELYFFHKKNKFDLTLTASAKNHEVPYGVCELDKSGHLQTLNEKPQLDFLINIGLYVIKKNIIKLIPKNKHFDMTDLINKAKKNKLKIGIFPIYDYNWIDVGQWEEYKKALNRL